MEFNSFYTQLNHGFKQLVAENPQKAKGIMLESDALYEQRLRREFEKNYAKGQKSLIHGAQLLKQALPSAEQLIDLQPNEEGKFNLSEENLQAFYEVVHHLMEERRLEDARDVLTLLLGLNPEKGEGWLDLAYLHYSLGSYEEALESFFAASQFLETDVRPYFYSITCLVKLDRKDNAKEMIEQLTAVLSEEDDNPLVAPWKEELENLRGNV